MGVGRLCRRTGQGSSLTDERRFTAARRLSRYSGLPLDIVQKANLRIDPGLFRSQLLADSRQVIGRFDGRIAGYNSDPLSREAEFDPSFNPYYAAYSVAFNQYVRTTLNFESDAKYEVLTGKVHPWNMGSGVLNVSDNLQRAMQANPNLKLLFASGTNDLATPYLATNYTIDHMNLSPELRRNIMQTYYPAGHMVYHPRSSAAKLHNDIRAFLEASCPHG